MRPRKGLSTGNAPPPRTKVIALIHDRDTTIISANPSHDYRRKNG
jgi:hypothetical protein